jgi:hypothetical protein
LAIADVAGGDWPEKARDAAKALSGDSNIGGESTKIQLLADIRQIFSDKVMNKLFSTEIVEILNELEGRPWGKFSKGKPLTKTKLANLLKPFGITPKQVWRDKNNNGYELEQFDDVFARYLPIQNSITLDASSDAASSEFQNSRDELALEFQSSPKALSDKDSRVLEFANGGYNRKYDNEGPEKEIEI